MRYVWKQKDQDNGFLSLKTLLKRIKEKFGLSRKKTKEQYFILLFRFLKNNIVFAFIFATIMKRGRNESLLSFQPSE